ncbi:MAG TPA: aldolase/citrate lyase family protein [Casimicrobiaceae bacterium]|nr:aldolase/citrate lyase family protein [Casimicrobiaceae bacterium]
MTLRSLFASDRIPVGHLIFEFATPGVGYLARNAGADYLILDLEHSGFTFETAKVVVLSARAAGLPLVLRVASHDAKELSRACDIGADGIMVPLVHTVDQARAIVAACKYAPEGARGVGQILMHDSYRAGPLVDKARAANEALVLILQIESREGAQVADAMAALDGVDCLWVGHFDLSCSLGSPGRFDTPEFEAAIDAVIAATRKHHIRAGRLAHNADEGAKLVASGFDCLAVATDTQLYQTALTQAIKAMRARIEEAKR